MLKTILLLLLLSISLSAAFGQQLAHRDSIVKAARADAKNFRLDDATWKKYRHKLAYTSDFFKPRAADVKNVALLNDSVFLDTYRHEAYKRNKRRRTPWHYVLVGGGSVAGLFVLMVTAIVIFVAPKMG
jgi:hypothetical protein